MLQNKYLRRMASEVLNIIDYLSVRSLLKWHHDVYGKLAHERETGTMQTLRQEIS